MSRINQPSLGAVGTFSHAWGLSPRAGLWDFLILLTQALHVPSLGLPSTPLLCPCPGQHKQNGFQHGP